MQFDEYDQLNLVLLPLMGNIENRSQMAVNVLKLAGIIEDKKRQRYLMACIIGIADKFLDDGYIEKFTEVVNIPRIFQAIINKAREEGEILRSQKVMQKFLLRKFGLKSTKLQQKIKQLNDLKVLDFVLEELFAVTNWDEAVAVINDGIRSLTEDNKKK